MLKLPFSALLLAALALLPARQLLADAPKVGDKPQFKYKTTDGKEVSPATLAGHVTILDFWATWCGPCMQMAPHMVELNKEYGEKGLAIIGISLDQDSAKMLAVAKEKELTWPQIFEATAGQPISGFWGVSGIPHCFILSPTGEVLWEGHPARMDQPLKDILLKYPFEAKKPADPAPAAPAVTAAPAVAKPSAPKIAPAILDAKLAAADKAKAAKHDLEAYDLYKWTALAAPGTEQAATAQIQVDTYNADPAFTELYKKNQHDREAASTLWLAQNLEKTGKTAEARTNYSLILANFADTPSVAEAKKSLARLK